MNKKGPRSLDPGETKKLVLITVSACLGLLAILSAPSSPVAQEVVIRFQKPLQHEVSVTLKLIQVYVTDKKGKAVQDLQKSDFIVSDNGQPKEITEFEKHLLAGPPAKTAPSAPTEKIVPTVVPPQPQVLRRKFFLFVDFAFNNQNGIQKAKEAALHFIDKEAGYDDEVGLISYSTLKGLTIHEYLTIEHQKIRKALEALNVKDIAGRAEDVEEEYWRQAVEGPISLGGVVSAKVASPADWRQEMKNQAQNFILKLTALAKALRYVPGQKHFLLFSTGIIRSLIYGGHMGNADGGRFDAGDFVLRTQNDEMLKELSSANCTVFTFDTRRTAKVPSLFTYDEQTFGTGGRNIFTASGAQQSTTSVFKDDMLTGLDTLKKLSGTTGGKYYSNIENYEKNLDQVQNLTGSYYVLGYYISEQWDGRYHDLKVEVKRKGLEVRAQAGYFNPKPFREFSDMEKRLHLYDLALSDRPLFQSPLTAGMTSLSGPATDAPYLFILTKIPAATIEKLTGSKVEIVSLIFDEQDNLADLRRAEENFARHQGKDVFYASSAVLQPGNYKCRLVIRDLETGSAAVASAKVHVSPKPEQGIRLHPPLLLVPAKNSVYLEGRLPGKKEDKAARISWNDYYPFDPGAFSPFIGELREGTSKITAVVPCTVKGIPLPTVAYTAHLLNSAGEKIPVAISSLNRVIKDDVRIQLLEFQLGELKPGNYVLYILAEELTTKAVSHTQVPLIIIP
ncbi:MAG: VWA domain-containing protein [Candidatus Aminicenantes bacterium]|nr:VWA domain-containing protein [Candidatus Aminicenantes bacterium]